jgi:serine/threonine protein kinase/tetratricopeptide (TPR) repeat protein
MPPQVVGTGSITSVVSEKPGDEIGGFTLLKEIGHGGFGIVYLAEQTAPVKRRVALKILKLGMDTKQVVARFEAERQALALMDHPNIARVIDAGATATGRPYFVMELVDGIKITDYCEQNHLTTPQRLDLFIQVCRAIQHAHQKGVIHRDIKPSNVLVATQDRVPVPKVIDFGIAKATQGKLTDQTVLTAFEQFLGTPAYISPEQAQLGGLDVDTRSDIYSLGVLLYELLTGKTPFDTKELLAAGLEAMRRTIQEKEPPTPSTRLKQDFESQRTQNPSDSKIKNQKSKIANDLDWIVMKCLEKDRARRYETANGLARDIERHLRNEVVVAGPPSRLYRFQKLVRRNKSMVAAIGIVTFVLVLGAAASTWQAIRATKAEHEQARLLHQAHQAQANEARERQKAQTEGAKSQQVAQFLKDMLVGVGPSVALGRDTTMLREILDKTAQRVGKELSNQPEVQIELLNTLANTYYELGLYKEMEAMSREELRLARARIGGEELAVALALKTLANAQLLLSDYAQAETSGRAALQIYRKVVGRESEEAADVMNSLAYVLQRQNKLEDAEAMRREALTLLRKILGNDHEFVAALVGNLSFLLWERGKLAEADALCREALTLMRKHYGDQHPVVATTLNNLGLILEDEGKLAETETVHREVLAMRRKLLGNEHPEVAQSLVNLAGTLLRLDKLQEAEGAAREALALFRKRLGNNHPDVASALGRLAFVLKDQGKLVEAEAMNREALTMRRKLLGLENLDVAMSLTDLGITLCAEGKRAEAETMHLDALAMRRKLLGEDHPDVTITRYNLALVLEAEGRLSEAETMYREVLTAQRKRFNNDHPEVGKTVNHLAHVLMSESRFADAEPLAREFLAISEQRSPDDWRTFNTRSLLGGALVGLQRYAESEQFLVSGYEGMKKRSEKIPAESQVNLREALQRLVRLYDATSQTNQAAEWKKRFEEFERAWKGNLPAATLPEKSSP